MLNAIFEEADLKSKFSTSLANGDWAGWTAGELDDLVKVGEDADNLIGRIIKSDKEFPDGLWEAFSRKYGPEELSGSILHYMVDEENGKVHLHQSYVDRLVSKDLPRLFQHVGPIASGVNKRMVGSRGEGNLQHLPWDTSEIEKAKRFVDEREAQKRKKSALKGLETRKANKTAEGRGGLRPVMTEHWHRWMPDQVPTEDTSWEKLRHQLKTTSKLDIEIMLREMEKAGVVAKGEHGNKIFKVDKYREIMDAPKERFPHSHIKNFEGTSLAKMQMLRGHGSQPALISVGMPRQAEIRWQKDHPKLYEMLKKVRGSNHKPVYKGIRPFGWARIDKLSDSEWLIEEIQQDVDAIASEDVGEAKYNARSHKGQYAHYSKIFQNDQVALEGYKKAKAALEEWLPIVKTHEAEWKEAEEKYVMDFGHVNNLQTTHGGPSIDGRAPDSLKQNFQTLVKTYEACREVGEYHPNESYWYTSASTERLLRDVNHGVKTTAKSVDEHGEHAQAFKRKIDKGDPEDKETQAWQTGPGSRASWRPSSLRAE